MMYRHLWVSLPKKRIRSIEKTSDHISHGGGGLALRKKVQAISKLPWLIWEEFFSRIIPKV